MSSLPEVLVAADPTAVTALAAERVITTIAEAVARAGRCRVALSGGTTPRALYQELARPTQQARIPWEAVVLYWGDERMVPQDHADSNYRMAVEALLSHVPAVEAQVHRIQTERGAQEAALHYAELLGDEPLDLVLLGMGDDGHTASLFPGDPSLSSEQRVVVTARPRPPQQRVSLSLGTINRAAAALLLVTGASKAAALGRAYDEIERGEPRLPIARVSPNGTLTWMIDEAAATRLGAANLTRTQPRG